MRCIEIGSRLRSGLTISKTVGFCGNAVIGYSEIGEDDRPTVTECMLVDTEERHGAKHRDGSAAAADAYDTTAGIAHDQLWRIRGWVSIEMTGILITGGIGLAVPEGHFEYAIDRRRDLEIDEDRITLFGWGTIRKHHIDQWVRNVDIAAGRIQTAPRTLQEQLGSKRPEIIIKMRRRVKRGGRAVSEIPVQRIIELTACGEHRLQRCADCSGIRNRKGGNRFLDQDRMAHTGRAAELIGYFQPNGIGLPARRIDIGRGG